MKKKGRLAVIALSIGALFRLPALAQDDVFAAFMQKYDAYRQIFAAIEAVEDIE